MKSKLFKDPIHGWMEFEPLLISVIDTIHFQRLRNVKQLAVCRLVYPGACHSRYEHSLGVAFLAGEMMSSIRDHQPDLEISDRLIHLVKLAGLCHDLGHGPFSHGWDNEILPLLDSDMPRDHEDRSKEILKYLVKTYDIQITAEELKKVILMIHPDGSPECQGFEYEIVANSVSGVDVDKFDYLMRDSFHIDGKIRFDAMAFVKSARAINNHICYPDKLILDLQDMFQTRYRMHKMVYNHPVVKAIEYMVTDALVKANHVLQFSKQPDDWLLPTDSLLDMIRFSRDIRLKESKAIVRRIDERDLYMCVHEEVLPINRKPKLPYVGPHDIVQDIRQGFSSGKSGHPMPKVYFYNRKDITRCFKMDTNEVSRILPPCYLERLVRVFVKSPRPDVPKIFICPDILEYMNLQDMSALNASSTIVEFHSRKKTNELVNKHVESLQAEETIDKAMKWVAECTLSKKYGIGKLCDWIRRKLKPLIRSFCEIPSEIALEFSEASELKEIVRYLEMFAIYLDNEYAIGGDEVFSFEDELITVENMVWNTHKDKCNDAKISIDKDLNIYQTVKNCMINIVKSKIF